MITEKKFPAYVMGVFDGVLLLAKEFPRGYWVGCLLGPISRSQNQAKLLSVATKMGQRDQAKWGLWYLKIPLIVRCYPPTGTCLAQCQYKSCDHPLVSLLVASLPLEA